MTLPATLFVLILLVAPVRDGAGAVLTDADIAAVAAQPWDKATMMDRHIVLGFHNGGRVVVDFPCGDVCPEYTTRIIHYEVEPGPGCGGLGGVPRHAIVGSGASSVRRAFCVPAVLGEKAIPLGGG
jgi:hypothetical protein